MSRYDPLQGRWEMPCPAQKQMVALQQFRYIQQLAGPERPAAYQIHYQCFTCEEIHVGLLTQSQLDLAPLMEPLNVHYDLSQKKMDWSSEGVRQLWSAAIQQGKWPLTIQCQQDDHVVGAWPSLLQAIAPNTPRKASRYLVQYRCPRCHLVECQEWKASRLTLLPQTTL